MTGQRRQQCRSDKSWDQVNRRKKTELKAKWICFHEKQGVETLKRVETTTVYCHFTSDDRKEVLILRWLPSSKAACKWSMNSRLLVYLTFLWAQAANIAGVIHLCIPKRGTAPCAAKTGTEGLASTKPPSAGLLLSQACLAPWVSSSEVWQKTLFGWTYLSSPLAILSYLYSLSSLLAFCLHESPSSVSLCASVPGNSEDNSVVLHTSSSSSASTVQTGRRGGCWLESFGSALSAVNHSRLLFERGKRSLRADHLGEWALLDGGGREGREKREKKREEKRGREKLREEMERKASAEIKGRRAIEEERDVRVAKEARWLWFASSKEQRCVARMFYSTRSCWERRPARRGWVCPSSRPRKGEADGGQITERGIRWTSLHFCDLGLGPAGEKAASPATNF